MSVRQLEPAVLYDSNMFLLTGDRTVLIDTGTGFDSNGTITSLKELLKGRKLDIVVITHRHYDHTGGLNAVINEFHPEVYAGHNDAVPLREGDSSSTLGTSFGGSIVPMDVKDLFEGDVIDIGEHRLRVVETPGHTIGSISLYDEMTRSMFTGDTVFIGGIGRYDLPTASGDQLRASLIRLLEFDFDAIYPGHGPCSETNGKKYVQEGLRMLEG